MSRSRDIRKVRNDVESLRRQIKIAQNRLFRSWNVAWATTLDLNVFAIMEQKERHFRSMKKRLAGMEERLRALREGNQEPIRVKPWKVSRPSAESRLIYFCEA